MLRALQGESYLCLRSTLSVNLTLVGVLRNYIGVLCLCSNPGYQEQDNVQCSGGVKILLSLYF